MKKQSSFLSVLSVCAAFTALGADVPASVDHGSIAGAATVSAGMKDIDKTKPNVEDAIRRELGKAAAAKKKNLAAKEEEFFKQFKEERDKAESEAKATLDEASGKVSDAESAVASAEKAAKDAARQARKAERAAADKNATAADKEAQKEAVKAQSQADQALAVAREKLAEANKNKDSAEENWRQARARTRESRAEARAKAKEAIDSNLPEIAVSSGESWLRNTFVDGVSLFDTLRGHAAAYGGDLAKAATYVQKRARENGYYIASVKVAEDGKSVAADPGSFGNVEVIFGDKVPTGGWRYSKKQIEDRIARSGVKPGVPFNYNDLYRSFYKLNGEPDIAADVRLTPPASGEKGESARELGVKFDVTKNDMPFHSVLGIDNYGTDSSGEWMARGTFQFLNLWQADHALTINALSSLKSDELLYGGAASYYMPFREGLFVRRDAALTFHGGFTGVDSENVVPSIDVEGEGWFVGVQGSVELLPDWNDSLRFALGVTYRDVWDRLVVRRDTGSSDPFKLEKTGVEVIPFSAALLWTGSVDEWFGAAGRTYATFELVANFLGSSDEKVARQRAAADRDYVLGHLQLARLQTIGGKRDQGEDGKETVSGSHMLFAKVDAQAADGAVVSAEQMGIGGANSVRGYKEREFLGDHAVTATLEYRTPLLLGGLGSLFEADWSDRLQFVAFCDVGWVGVEDALPGEDDSTFLASLGAGLRAAWSDWSLLRLDYGIPLEETSESKHSGRLHISIQTQF